MADNIVPFNFESQEIRTVTKGDDLWFVAVDVACVLEYRDASAVVRLLSKHEVATSFVSTKGGRQKALILSEAGLKRILQKTRSLNARNLSITLGMEVVAPSKEEDNIRVVAAAFKHLNPVHQFFVLGYRIDLYFPSVRLAVECDENGHFDRPSEFELLRQDAITKALGCYFIRFNPDDKNFNIGNVINKIMLTLEGYT